MRPVLLIYERVSKQNEIKSPVEVAASTKVPVEVAASVPVTALASTKVPVEVAASVPVTALASTKVPVEVAASVPVTALASTKVPVEVAASVPVTALASAAYTFTFKKKVLRDYTKFFLLEEQFKGSKNCLKISSISKDEKYGVIYDTNEGTVFINTLEVADTSDKFDSYIVSKKDTIRSISYPNAILSCIDENNTYLFCASDNLIKAIPLEEGNHSFECAIKNCTKILEIATNEQLTLVTLIFIGHDKRCYINVYSLDITSGKLTLKFSKNIYKGLTSYYITFSPDGNICGGFHENGYFFFKCNDTENEIIYNTSTGVKHVTVDNDKFNILSYSASEDMFHKDEIFFNKELSNKFQTLNKYNTSSNDQDKWLIYGKIFFACSSNFDKISFLKKSTRLVDFYKINLNLEKYIEDRTMVFEPYTTIDKILSIHSNIWFFINSTLSIAYSVKLDM